MTGAGDVVPPFVPLLSDSGSAFTTAPDGLMAFQVPPSHRTAPTPCPDTLPGFLSPVYRYSGIPAYVT
jgi:hypothetical protein